MCVTNLFVYHVVNFVHYLYILIFPGIAGNKIIVLANVCYS